MKIKLDENLPEDAVTILRDAGHEVFTVVGQGLGGKTDAEAAAACKAESKVLITLDIDFGNLAASAPADYPGIIVLRLANQAGLWIVDEYRIRIRPGGE